MILVGPELSTILDAKFEFMTDLLFIGCMLVFLIAQFELMPLDTDLSKDCLLDYGTVLVLPKAMALV